MALLFFSARKKNSLYNGNKNYKLKGCFNYVKRKNRRTYE